MSSRVLRSWLRRLGCVGLGCQRIVRLFPFIEYLRRPSVYAHFLCVILV